MKTINLFKVQEITKMPKFQNLLHDPVKAEIEQEVAEYAGAKYGVAVTSATDAIFLCLKSLDEKNVTCTVPSLSTTRFMNAIVYSTAGYVFTDDTTWVGHDYMLYESDDTSVIDSAQRLDKNQYKEYKPNDLLIFSNYPTKPLGGLKGGIIVSDNKEKIDWIRQAAYFGESFATDSWNGKSNFIGWQMYMNSVEAYFVKQALKGYAKKRQRLDDIREMYFSELGNYIQTGDSYHLFRVFVGDNVKFMQSMKSKGIITGIHYKPAHLDPVYNQGKSWACINSEYDGRTVASIPFHDGLSNTDVKHVIKSVKEYYRKNKI